MNKDILSKVCIFAVGAAIGSAVTWKLIDTKYSKRVDQELKEIEEYYENNYTPKIVPYSGPASSEEEVQMEAAKEEYKTIVANNYSGKKGGSESMEIGTAPYVIPPDEYDMEDDYDAETLTYYTDGVLADDNDKIIEDVANIVGNDFASHFGEYEDDTVFIRNERLKTDYEICMDYRPYKDVVGSDSDPADDE